MSADDSSPHQADTPAPWINQQLQSLLAQRGHAWLLHGPSGLGQYSLALELVRAWLCERVSPQGACRQCGSCHAIEVRTHADLYVLMPEVTMLALDWPLSEKAQHELDTKTRKPSKEIRVEAMREAIEFTQRTNARGGGKAVLVYPAESMNTVSASALLKTLEEPPGNVKFVLASEAAHQLLPTIRSRCLGHTMHWPSPPVAQDWLLGQGIATSDAAQLLGAAGGRPLDALALVESGRSAAEWAQFPTAMLRSDAGFVKDWSIVQLVDALQKLCHDALTTQLGAPARFFPASALAPVAKAPMLALSEWSVQLRTAHKTMEHPYNLGLMQEALVAQAHIALHSKAAP